MHHRLCSLVWVRVISVKWRLRFRVRLGFGVGQTSVMVTFLEAGWCPGCMGGGKCHNYVRLSQSLSSLFVMAEVARMPASLSAVRCALQSADIAYTGCKLARARSLAHRHNYSRQDASSHGCRRRLRDKQTTRRIH